MAIDEHGLDVPGHDDGNPATCESCHDLEPHDRVSVEGVEDPARALNRHVEFIACQTCHIPEFARGQATKMTWDWSTAGEKNEEGAPFVVRDEETGDVA